ncbi:hypothetical protein K432DRAFT_398453 [Lepidopterella palustris CBS 459.81]|uniref:Uncharacterized protein n=1 Tax=Lepidopterella palustris CBS 459.81 TaxID=1314670 RepID=A0A8E2J943_9PEZI|nr:hypothetical protein K432DRAFT_398453 [Lepidopterella palustris CBS 459.81]
MHMLSHFMQTFGILSDLREIILHAFLQVLEQVQIKIKAVDLEDTEMDPAPSSWNRTMATLMETFSFPAWQAWQEEWACKGVEVGPRVRAARITKFFEKNNAVVILSDISPAAHVPVGVLTLLLIMVIVPANFPHQGDVTDTPLSLKEKFGRTSMPKINLAGVPLLLGASLLLVTVLLEGGTEIAWSSATCISLLVISTLLWCLFMFNEPKGGASAAAIYGYEAITGFGTLLQSTVTIHTLPAEVQTKVLAAFTEGYTIQMQILVGFARAQALVIGML